MGCKCLAHPMLVLGLYQLTVSTGVPHQRDELFDSLDSRYRLHA